MSRVGFFLHCFWYKHDIFGFTRSLRGQNGPSHISPILAFHLFHAFRIRHSRGSSINLGFHTHVLTLSVAEVQRINIYIDFVRIQTRVLDLLERWPPGQRRGVEVMGLKWGTRGVWADRPTPPSLSVCSKDQMPHIGIKGLRLVCNLSGK